MDDRGTKTIVLQDETLNGLLQLIENQEQTSAAAQRAVVHELMRRECQLAANKKQIEDRLAAYEADERGHYPTATVLENAPLALIQVTLETGKRELKWALRLLDDKGE